MTELATLRWGDVQQFSISPTVAQEGTNVTNNTKQLVQAAWRVPMSWNVILFALPQINLLENGTLSINWLFTLGAGQAVSSEIALFTMGPFNKTTAPAGGTAVTQTQQLVPSENLQIRCQVITNFLSTNTSTVLVGAFVAPNNAEVLAEDIVAAAMRGEDPPHEQGQGDMRWMPGNAFYGDLDPLTYRNRR